MIYDDPYIKLTNLGNAGDMQISFREWQTNREALVRFFGLVIALSKTYPLSKW